MSTKDELRKYEVTFDKIAKAYNTYIRGVEVNTDISLNDLAMGIEDVLEDAAPLLETRKKLENKKTEIFDIVNSEVGSYHTADYKGFSASTAALKDVTVLLNSNDGSMIVKRKKETATDISKTLENSDKQMADKITKLDTRDPQFMIYVDQASTYISMADSFRTTFDADINKGDVNRLVASPRNALNFALVQYVENKVAEKSQMMDFFLADMQKNNGKLNEAYKPLIQMQLETIKSEVTPVSKYSSTAVEDGMRRFNNKYEAVIVAAGLKEQNK